MKRLTGIVLTAAALALIGFAVAQRTASKPQHSQALAVLLTPSLRDGDLPAGISNSRGLGLHAIHFGQSIGGHRVYIAQGKGATVCLLAARGGSTTADCAGRSALDSGAIYLTEPQGALMNVYAVLPDGFSKAVMAGYSHTVVHNTAAFVNVPISAKMTLSGQLPTRTIDFGPQYPSSTVTTHG